MPRPSASTESSTIAQVLEHHIAQDTKTSTVIVACCKRSYLLTQLLHVANPQQTSNSTSAPNPLDEDMLLNNDNYDDNIPISAVSQSHNSILHSLPTLHLLSVAEHTQLVFCPNIPTLRAYLAALPSTLPSSATQLLVLNLLALHDGTSEFSVQGLSRSFALVASCAAKLGSDSTVRVLECTDARDLENQYAGPRLWRNEVPLLSGSIKIGEAGQGWAHRTVGVRKVAERWFKFD